MADKELDKYMEQQDSTALQKSKIKVIELLQNEPIGLSISQIMSMCKISVKTAKNILSVIDVDCTNGVYILKKSSKAPERLKEVLTVSKKENNILDSLKENIVTTTIVRKEVVLSKDQLSILLTDLFGLKFVEYHDDGSVLLSEIV